MTHTYNIHEATTHFCKLLRQVRNGDGVFIAKAGKTFAKIIPADNLLKKTRPLGTARGQIQIAPDFDAPDPALEDHIYNGPIISEDHPTHGKKRK